MAMKRPTALWFHAVVNMAQNCVQLPYVESFCPTPIKAVSTPRLSSSLNQVTDVPVTWSFQQWSPVTSGQLISVSILENRIFLACEPLQCAIATNRDIPIFSSTSLHCKELIQIYL